MWKIIIVIGLLLIAASCQRVSWPCTNGLVRRSTVHRSTRIYIQCNGAWSVWLLLDGGGELAVHQWIGSSIDSPSIEENLHRVHRLGSSSIINKLYTPSFIP